MLHSVHNGRKEKGSVIHLIWSDERLHDQQYPLAQMETLLTTTEVIDF
jgi:hypothetical protein